MLQKQMVPKHVDLGSPIVIVTIQGVQVQNALVDLEESINLMKIIFFSHLNINSLRENPTVLQLFDISTMKPDGMVETYNSYIRFLGVFD